MNWDNIQYFLAVARTGSLSGAAKQLQVNHSTVARRLDKLEQQLEIRLFDRLNNGYQLTASGQALQQEALRLEEQVNQINRRFKGQEQQLTGTLKVSKPSSGILNLAPLITDFHKQFPHITVELTAGTAFSNLTRMEADIAIRLTETPPQDVIAKKLGHYPLYVYGSHDYLATLPAPVHPGNCDWLIWQQPGSELDMEQMIKNHLPNAKVVLRSNSYSEIYEAVVAGLGVSLLSPLRLPQGHQLQALAPENFQHTMTLWLLSHPDLRNSARVKAFKTFISEKLQPLLGQ
ncbi:MAG: LysR family transcriptional regulator [Pseudomonadales bacterium]|nr:LysR family transcriptional regulator [Pseudomonadales bacterium]